MDLGRCQRLLEARLGEDRRQAAGEHGLATAGRAGEQNVVPAGGGDLQGALGVLLAAHLGKVFLRRAAGREQGGGIDRAEVDGTLAGEEIDHLAEATGAVNRQAIDQRPFTGVLLRHDEAVDLPGAGGDGDRQYAAHRLDPAVEGELAHEQVAFAWQGIDDAGGEEQADRHGEVEGGAVFADIGRGEIDGDAAGGEGVAGVFDRRLDAILALLDRPVRQADGGELR